jgi:uncharacterized protein with PIN domain
MARLGLSAVVTICVCVTLKLIRIHEALEAVPRYEKKDVKTCTNVKTCRKIAWTAAHKTYVRMKQTKRT